MSGQIVNLNGTEEERLKACHEAIQTALKQFDCDLVATAQPKVYNNGTMIQVEPVVTLIAKKQE